MATGYALMRGEPALVNLHTAAGLGNAVGALATADHAMVSRTIKIGRETRSVPTRAAPDEEVTAISDWLRPRLSSVTRGEGQIAYRELRQILTNFGFAAGAPKNHKVPIVVTETRGLFIRRERKKTVMTIDWPGDGRTVTFNQIKHMRRTLKLCEEDGVTRDAFYSQGVRIDSFINDYRLVLRKLASR
jgi:hypothetical protein